MKRLRGSDAYPVYAETPASPFVTLKVVIYRPTDGSIAPDTDEIANFVKTSVAGITGGTAGMRILRVPFDLHHPVWVADPDYSPDNHIHRARLPAPGDRQQLCDFLSELMGTALPSDRPPWEVWLIEGLSGGRSAVALKVHHSLGDGKRLARLIEESHAMPLGEEAQARAAAREPLPGRSRLIADALIDLVKSYTVELPHYYRHLQQARRTAPKLEIDGEHNSSAFSAPFSVLNEQGGRERIYRYQSFSLAGFKALSKRLGCTVNTLVLGVCSEALRRYLQELDAVPAEPLVAAMPMAVQEGNNLKTLLNSDIQNNLLAITTVPLFQNIADLTARLQAISRASRAAIDHVLLSNGRRFDNYLDFMPGTLLRLLNASQLAQQAKRKNLLANLSISNVPGPRRTLYALDGRLEMTELLSCGNLADTGNINITVWSYVDNLCFSFLFRKDALPEPEKLVAHLTDVVTELEDMETVAPVPGRANVSG